MSRSRGAVRLIRAFLLLVIVGACDATEPRGPGAISVSSFVESPDNFFEYGISIDNGTPREAIVGQTLLFTQTGMSHGEHTVRVIGSPQTCTGTTSRVVNLRGDDTASVIFTLNCPRITGDLRLTIVTTGSDLDQNGYLLTVNGQPQDDVPTNGTITYRFVQPATYVLGLTDVASNCTTPASQSAAVTAGAETSITFTITCSPVAVFKFINSTSGTDRDPDGLLASVDADVLRLSTNGTVNMRVPVGTRTYTLSDVQPNCTVTGPTTGTHTVAAGDTVTVTTSLDCTTIPNGTPGTTSASDPAADTLANMTNGPSSYDIIGVSSRYTPGFLIMVVRFQKDILSPATGSISALYGYLEFDIDESSTTGKHAFANDFGAGNSTQGVDYYANFFATDTASVQVVRTPTEAGPWFSAGRIRVYYAGDSLTVAVPLNKLAGDDGKMTVTMLLGTGDRPNDIAPNVGQIVVQPPAAPIMAVRADRREPAFELIEVPRHATGTWKRNR